MSLFYLKMLLRNNPTVLSTAWNARSLLFRLKAMQNHEGRRLVQRGDDAVIDGYPRSANSFAHDAFAAAQGRPVRVGNHFHSPAQFALARRYGVPAMLVLREPVEAALSWVVFHDGGFDAEKALQFYTHFHRPLLRMTDSFVVAPFEEVTSDYGRSIQRLNDHFGSGFNTFEHNEDSAREIFDKLAAQLKRRDQAVGRNFSALRLHYPDARKEERRQQIREAFERPSLDGLKSEARGQYDTLMATLAGEEASGLASAGHQPIKKRG